MLNQTSLCRVHEIYWKGVELVTIIVVLAMIFALLALRLYSVLGRRTGHEQQQLPTPVNDGPAASAPVGAQADGRTAAQRAADNAVAVSAQTGLRSVIAIDRNFDVAQFLGGARAAYGMILAAFWKGDRETLQKYCAPDVYEAFSAAIDQREAEGLTLDNKLVRIDETRIVDARVEGNVAYVAVHLEADLSAVTRDRDGNVVAGSLDDAISTVETWTFSRDLSSRDPNWELSETDEG
jgi:predicted lipid-binding transport protein (Tim44 family)